MRIGVGWLVTWLFVLYFFYCVLAFLSGNNPWSG